MTPVTVFMPAYNAAAYIEESIKSILTQTWTDFEFLIIDDGSTDDTVNIIKRYATTDSRIRFIQNKTNLGLIQSRNLGLTLTTTPLLALLDSDDIAKPNRLATQIEFMQANPSVDICGTFAQCFGDSTHILTFPLTHDAIKIHLLWGSQLANPTVIMRKDLIDNYQLNYTIEPAEDYQFWVDCSQQLTLHNINQPLTDYRRHDSNLSKTLACQQAHKKVQQQQLNQLGLTPSASQLDFHYMLSQQQYLSSQSQLHGVSEWFLQLINANNITAIYEPTLLNYTLAKKFFYYCFYSSRWGLSSYHEFTKSYLYDHFTPSLKLKIEFYLRCLFKVAK